MRGRHYRCLIVYCPTPKIGDWVLAFIKKCSVRSSLGTHKLSARTSGNATLYRLSLASRTALSTRAHRKLPGENYEITPSSRAEHRAGRRLTQMKLYLLRPLYIVTVYFHIFIAILFASSLAWACRDKLS